MLAEGDNVMRVEIAFPSNEFLRQVLLITTFFFSKILLPGAMRIRNFPKICTPCSCFRPAFFFDLSAMDEVNKLNSRLARFKNILYPIIFLP
jgi:hypothetical protein